MLIRIVDQDREPFPVLWPDQGHPCLVVLWWDHQLINCGLVRPWRVAVELAVDCDFVQILRDTVRMKRQHFASAQPSERPQFDGSPDLLGNWERERLCSAGYEGLTPS